MRLTKSMKEDIIVAAIVDKYGDQLKVSFEKLKEAIKHIILDDKEVIAAIEFYKSVPEKYKSFINTYNSIWSVQESSARHNTHISNYLLEAVNRDCLGNRIIINLGLKTTISLDNPIPCDQCQYVIDIDELPKKEWKEVNDIAKKACDLKLTLEKALNKVTTINKAVKLIPELQKYIEKQSPTSTALVEVEIYDKARQLLKGVE